MIGKCNRETIAQLFTMKKLGEKDIVLNVYYCIKTKFHLSHGDMGSAQVLPYGACCPFFFFDSLDLSDLYYVVLTCGIFTMNRSIWLLTYNYSKWVCQNHCRFSKKVKESTVSLNWSLLLKLLNMTECHWTPRFLYMSRAGLIWPKFYIIPFLISKNASTSSLILKLLL